MGLRKGGAKCEFTPACSTETVVLGEVKSVGLAYSNPCRTYDAGPAPEPEPEPEPPLDVEALIQREKDMATAWAAKLKTLTKREHLLYHWFVTCGVPKNRTCKELGLKTWEFELLAKSAGEKLDVPLTVIRTERRAILSATSAAA